VIVMPLNRIHHIDPDTAIVDVDAGVSLDQLMKAALPYGLWVPVLPGTRQVTIGGAIANDVHGKNHHTKGSFGNHVLSVDSLTADGTTRELTLTTRTASRPGRDAVQSTTSLSRSAACLPANADVRTVGKRKASERSSGLGTRQKVHICERRWLGTVVLYVCIGGWNG
jgi:FAD/FMN-containing dehydrogenase